MADTTPSTLAEFLSTDLSSVNIKDDPTRPYVTLTFAQSLDAKIAGKEGQQLMLSGKESTVMTHRLRTMHDAILVGIGTALNDDPQLNVRYLPSPPTDAPPHHLPRPVILDTHLRLPPTCKLLQNYNSGLGLGPWILSAYPETHVLPEWLARKVVLESAGAKVFLITANNGMLSIPDVLQKLRELNIRSLMVEGGAAVIASFLRVASDTSKTQFGLSKAVVDMLIITVAPTIVGAQGVSYVVEQLPDLQHVRTEVLGRDTIMAMKVVKNNLRRK